MPTNLLMRQWHALSLVVPLGCWMHSLSGHGNEMVADLVGQVPYERQMQFSLAVVSLSHKGQVQEAS